MLNASHGEPSSQPPPIEPSLFHPGTLSGNHFIAMEFVHGEDVWTILRRRDETRPRMPLGPALQIAIGVCGALHYAHELTDLASRPLRIVHRDVSPPNILATWSGSV